MRYTYLLAAALFAGALNSALAATSTFSNTTPLALPDGISPFCSGGPGATVVSTINVTGITGALTDVSAALLNVSSTFTADLDVLLVGPGGQALLLISDVRARNDLTDVTLTFDDTGTVPAQTSQGNITSDVTWAPTNYLSDLGGPEPDPFPAPGIGTAYTDLGSFANAFVGLSGAAVNGTWTLYAVDDCALSPNAINGGWSLTLEFSSIPATIPTLNGWGIALFSALLGLLGWRNSRRSRGLKAKRG